MQLKMSADILQLYADDAFTSQKVVYRYLMCKKKSTIALIPQLAVDPWYLGLKVRWGAFQLNPLLLHLLLSKWPPCDVSFCVHKWMRASGTTYEMQTLAPHDVSSARWLWWIFWLLFVQWEKVEMHHSSFYAVTGWDLFHITWDLTSDLLLQTWELTLMWIQRLYLLWRTF